MVASGLTTLRERVGHSIQYSGSNLDEKFFGSRDEDIQESQFLTARVHLLGEEAQKSMEMVVERKMNDAKERVLVDWDPATAKQLLQEALGDYSGSQS